MGWHSLLHGKMNLNILFFVDMLALFNTRKANIPLSEKKVLVVKVCFCARFGKHEDTMKKNLVQQLLANQDLFS